MREDKTQLPGYVGVFLRFICPAHLLEEIEGDLLQKYDRDITRFGSRKAGRRLIYNTIRFFRGGILTRNRISIVRKRNLMIKNNMKLMIRQVARNKTYSLVNILGLTIGIFASLLIAQFVLFEWSFERYNKNADKTYRVNLYNTSNGVFTGISPGTVSGLGYVLQRSFPGIEAVARLSSRVTGIVASDDHSVTHMETEIVYADASILDLLAIDLLEGQKYSVLKTPQSILISESAARKYFGDTMVSGKTLQFGFNNGSVLPTPYQIGGVFRDIPANALQHFHFILPPASDAAWNENWAWSNVSTYVRLSENVDPASLEHAMLQIVRDHHQDSAGDRYLLEPITRIRLYALDGSGRATFLGFLVLLGIIILLLAWFNYINLSTARFFERMKVVGIRKLIGATRAGLVVQFLSECLFFNVISFACAALVFFLSWPLVTQFLGYPIPLTFFKDPMTIVFAVCFILTSTLFAGLYPSMFLSSFRPIQVLKGRLTGFADRSTIRKAMVVVQLSVSILLITAVLAIQRQIGFMREQKLGISIDQTLIIEEPLLTDAASVNRYETFRNDVLQLPGVRGVTYASSFPGAEIDWHRTDITLGQENADYRYDSRIIAIGTEFLDMFGIRLVTGRNFDPAIESDKKAMLISEAAAKMFGFGNYGDALGKVVFIGNRQFEVIGVVNNYHYRSLQNQIQPLLYMQGYPRGPRYAIKISPGDFTKTIPAIESIWKVAYAGNIFNYYFLDDHFDRQYASERQTGTIVSALTLLAIFISASGLFGLTLYSVNRRTREIGIRKILGATVSNVVLLLSRDFIRLMVIGGFLAIPLAYFIMKWWLDAYAYRMPLNAWLFIIPFVATTLLMWITITFQTATAARSNPVDSMRYE